MAFIVRVIINGIALWITAALLSGIDVTSSGWGKVGTYLLVGFFFGVVNAVIKPIVYVLGLPFIIVTLGLFALVVNGLLFWFVGWLADVLDIPFHVDGFWWAFLGAIVMGIVGWIISLAIPGRS